MGDMHIVQSGDLTDSCQRRVALKLEGSVSPEIPTATYRGLVAGEAVQYMHCQNIWNVTAAVIWARAKIEADLEEQGKIITTAVEQNKPEIIASIEAVLDHYVRRFMPKLAKLRVIGSELPVRWHCTTHRDKLVNITFQSHLDMLARDIDGVVSPPGTLICFDFKWRMNAPSNAYLARYKQFMMYCMCIYNGSTRITDNGGWVEFGEWPRMCWVDLSSCKPYGRAVTTMDDDGTEREFHRGDDRPERKIFRWIFYDSSRFEHMLDELLLVAGQQRLGIFPQSPDPIGCSLCPCESWCDRFDTPPLDV